MLLKHSSWKKGGLIHEQTCNLKHLVAGAVFWGGGGVFLFLFLVTACHYLDYSASQ